jgi:hypothetical protein
MLLSDTDALNAERIEKSTAARSKAHGLSIALTLTRYIIDQIMKGNELLVRTKDGKLERVVMPELENVRHDAEGVRSTAG